jgi:hypothetical protein
LSITRLFQSGAELGVIGELASFPNNDYGGFDITVSTTAPRTGARSFAMSSNNQRPRGKAFTATQIRAGFYLRHNNLTATRQGVLWVAPGSFATETLLYWDEASGELRLRVNNSTVASISAAAAGFATVNTYYHIGVTFKANASTGFISVYLDGVQVLTYSGNTGTTISGFYVGGGIGAFGTWSNTAYIDDLYVDDTTGEADAPPSSLRFDWKSANGAGTATGLSVSAGTNYQAVDDIPVNDDTDYVYAASSGLKDYYTVADFTLPAGYVVNALIPTSWARRTDAGTDSQWKLGTRLSGTDVIGSARSMGTSYGVLYERQTTKPGGGAWSESDVNSAEFVHESAGSF